MAIAITLLNHSKRSCTKHGPYDGPYCQACYVKSVSGIDESEIRDKTPVGPSTSEENGSKDDFERELLELRAEKDRFFRTDLDSPIKPEQRSSFKGLSYYAPWKDYRVIAKLERPEKPEPVQIVTSAETRQLYLKYGLLQFELVGEKLRLVVYKSTEDPFARSMFVPFSDETSGSETYAAGRYLDIEEYGGDLYELDFNLAYNPYCAYNDDYTCPVPPKENKLTVRVLAGEKNYK